MSDQAGAALQGNIVHAQRRMAGGTAYIEMGQVEGRQREVIIFVHGVGLNAQAWQPQLEKFSATHRVVALDLLGHGESTAPDPSATLDSYVQQLGALMSALGIAQANIVGHSMGGLVAMGFALAQPQRTLRLGVFNAVYQRPPSLRAAVEARAHTIASSGTTGNIEEPVERWFGQPAVQPAAAKMVRAWLSSVDPAGYGVAYRIFAESDDAFIGKLGALAMPALFATGAGDGNSSPEMAAAMANEVQRGRVLVLDEARHMMNLTHPAEVNAALHELLQEATDVIDPKALRRAFGTFMTGVTVVTTREADGSLRGFTANSFSSVSLEPPLLLVCVNKAAASCETFAAAPSFAINILAETQKAVSGTFASKRADKFADVNWHESRSGNPLIAGAVAWFDCARHSVVDAGDHLILIGRVTSFADTDANPLGYARGGYFTLGLEHSAVNAAGQSGRTEVGAILECDGKLLVFPNKDGNFELPHVGRDGEAGSTTRLLAMLKGCGITAKLGFLFAVFENPDLHTQSIYYRGVAQGMGTGQLMQFDELALDKFADDAMRSMLKRYGSERRQGRYKIYSGDHVRGDVRDVID